MSDQTINPCNHIGDSMNSNRMRNYLLAASIFLIFVAAVVGSAAHIIYRMRSEAQELNAAVSELAQMFKGGEIDYGFQIVDGQVVFGRRNHSSALFPERVLTPVEGADAATFRSLDQVFPERLPRVYYGVDKNHVFVHHAGRTGRLSADPATFRLLDPAGRFACDAHNVYFRMVTIEGADPDSFRRLKGDFSVDDNHAYLGHITLPADAATFQATSYGYISDCWRGTTYFKGPYTTEGWNRDANNIYFGNKRLEVADPETFQDLTFAGYAKDANHVYYELEIVEGADPASFEVLRNKWGNFFAPTLEHPTGNGPFARDKNHFYWYTEIYEREGPWFHQHDGQALQPQLR